MHCLETYFAHFLLECCHARLNAIELVHSRFNLPPRQSQVHVGVLQAVLQRLHLSVAVMLISNVPEAAVHFNQLLSQLVSLCSQF